MLKLIDDRQRAARQRFVALNLTAGSPSLGTPRLRQISRAAIRKRNERTRDALETKQYQIETHRDRLIMALLEHERVAKTLSERELTELAETFSKKKLTAEVKLILEFWVAIWLGEKKERRMV